MRVKEGIKYLYKAGGLTIHIFYLVYGSTGNKYAEPVQISG